MSLVWQSILVAGSVILFQINYLLTIILIVIFST